MNKRGQFYIIIVLVLALTIYGITYESNDIQETKTFEDFNDISQNYLIESKKIINTALKEERNPLPDLEPFTGSFLTYAKSRDPGLELLYIYSNGNDIVLQNYLDDTVFSPDINPIPGAGQEIIQEITIEIAGKTYTYQVPVSAGEFGSQWYTGQPGQPPEGFDLSIGGITHNFNLPTNSESFNIIIRTETNDYTIICQGGSCNLQQ